MTATDKPTLAAAVAKVQASLPHITKDKTANAGQYSYTFANLASISPAILPLLAAEGLAWLCKPTLDDNGNFVLRYTLKHAGSGEQDGGDFPLPDPTRTTLQQIGSAITYARRYCLCSVIGLVPDEDDDAQVAGDAKAAQPRRGRQAPEPPPVQVDHAFVEDWLARLDLAGSEADMTALRDEAVVAYQMAHRIDADTSRMLAGRWEARKAELTGAAA